MEGYWLATHGEGVEGIAKIHQGLSDLRTTGAELARTYALTLLAEAYGKMGQVEGGLAVLAEAMAIADTTEEHWCKAELYRLYGELLLRLGDGETGQTGEKKFVALSSGRFVTPMSPEACFLKAIDIARHQQAKSWELRAKMSLARLRQQQAMQSASCNRQYSATKLHEAYTMLSETYHWFTEGFDTKDLQEAEALLKSLASNVKG